MSLVSQIQLLALSLTDLVALDKVSHLPVLPFLICKMGITVLPTSHHSED